ncbi:hypothetical protein GC175_17080 [bacterium]|nr:hypothetical protein [bacterium]
MQRLATGWDSLGMSQRDHGIFDNLLANPGGEGESLSNWFASAQNAERSSAEAHTGTYSLRLNPSGGTGDWRASVFLVEANRVYQVSGVFKGQGSGQTFLTIRWWSDLAGTAFVKEDNIPLPSTYADWTKIAQSFTAPATAQSADLMFRCPATTTADIYGDNFGVQRS